MNEQRKIVALVSRLNTGQRRIFLDLSSLEKMILVQMVSAFYESLPKTDLFENFRRFLNYLRNNKGKKLFLSYDELQFMRYLLPFIRKNTETYCNTLKWRQVLKIHKKFFSLLSVFCIKKIESVFNQTKT